MKTFAMKRKQEITFVMLEHKQKQKTQKAYSNMTSEHTLA